MRDHHTDDQARRDLLERQLANYLKTAACLTGVTRERVEMLAKLVREELTELDESARVAASRRAAAGSSAWGPRAPWRLGDRPGFAGKTRKASRGDPVGAGPSGPHPGRGRARGVA